MLKGAEIRICKEVMMMRDPSLSIKLDQFFHYYKGWEMMDDFHTLERIIVFTSPETFKQFLIEFAESDTGRAMTKGEAIEHLEQKGLDVKLLEG